MRNLHSAEIRFVIFASSFCMNSDPLKIYLLRNTEPAADLTILLALARMEFYLDQAFCHLA